MYTRTKGFTLVELLVAISIMAIVAVLGWRGLDSIVRARVALNNELTQTRGLQLAFAQMQSDADHIASGTSIGNRPTLAVEPGRLTMIRTVFAENQPSRLQVIAYRVQNGVLTRRETLATRDWAELDASWNAALADTDGGQPVVLHREISGMTLRTWDNSAKAWRADVRLAGTPRVAQQPGQPAQQPQALNRSVTGLEVALRLQDRSTDMVKIFLLGAV